MPYDEKGNWEHPGSTPIEKLRDELAINQRKLDYRLDVMDMKVIWDDSEEENLDSSSPIVFEKYIDPTTKVIDQGILRLRLLNFRSYGTVTEGGAVTINSTDLSYVLRPGPSVDNTFSGGGHGHTVTINDAGSHDHAGAVAADGTHSHANSVSTVADHAHALYDHSHSFIIAPHTHGIVHGIYKSTTATTNVTVGINGVDRTVALGGPFSGDQDSIDIRPYLTSTGWQQIEIGTTSTSPGRVRASLFVKFYLP